LWSKFIQILHETVLALNYEISLHCWYTKVDKVAIKLHVVMLHDAGCTVKDLNGNCCAGWDAIQDLCLTVNFVDSALQSVELST
jgi:hypothetical protein